MPRPFSYKASASFRYFSFNLQTSYACIIEVSRLLPRFFRFQLRQGPDPAQPGGVPQRRGRPADPAPARRRHPRGAAQPRHLLPQAGRRQRGVLTHQGPRAHRAAGVHT